MAQIDMFDNAKIEEKKQEKLKFIGEGRITNGKVWRVYFKAVGKG